MSEIDNQDQNQQPDSPETPQHSGAAFGGGDTASSGALENNNSGLFQAKGHINQVDLETEMQRSYLDYAMSVIVGRALPEVRDGLKPVHRRILYAMYDGGYRPNAGFSKCMRVVGDVMGHFH
ncbi:DNA gyrase subunit A, partial [Varibaculum cambriense]|uniref:DNA gyrase subunit A n=1 Tax=Varibaculum cambriense TaxID=184870 RepID=UPI002914DCE2